MPKTKADEAFARAAFLERERMLTIEEVAAMLNVSTRYVQKLIGIGELHPIKVGSLLRFERKTLAADLQSMSA